MKEEPMEDRVQCARDMNEQKAHFYLLSAVPCYA